MKFINQRYELYFVDPPVELSDKSLTLIRLRSCVNLTDGQAHEVLHYGELLGVAIGGLELGGLEVLCRLLRPPEQHQSLADVTIMHVLQHRGLLLGMITLRDDYQAPLNNIKNYCQAQVQVQVPGQVQVRSQVRSKRSKD